MYSFFIVTRIDNSKSTNLVIDAPAANSNISVFFPSISRVIFVVTLQIPASLFVLPGAASNWFLRVLDCWHVYLKTSGISLDGTRTR
jgi:hypothetical protein